jgi:Flp pilus assembly protein TadD
LRRADELRDVVRADPSDAAAWVARGVAERGRGKPDEAERAYKKAIEADAPGAPPSPDALDARYNLGVLYMDWKKEPAKAREALADFVKSAPGKHGKVKDAEARLKELAPRSELSPQSGGTAPAPAAQDRPSGGSAK